MSSGAVWVICETGICGWLGRMGFVGFGAIGSDHGCQVGESYRLLLIILLGEFGDGEGWVVFGMAWRVKKDVDEV